MFENVIHHELINVSAKCLKSFVIDPFKDQCGFRAYIADASDETIIIYSLGNRISTDKSYMEIESAIIFLHINYVRIPGQNK